MPNEVAAMKNERVRSDTRLDLASEALNENYIVCLSDCL